jgi:hypothetical protein
VVGINIAKVVSEQSGLAFARPIALLAARYLGDRSVAALRSICRRPKQPP